MEHIKESETIEIGNTIALATTQASSIIITNSVQMETAGEFLRGLKTIRQRIKDTFDGPIASAHKAHRDILAAKAKHDKPLQAAESFVKGRIGDYHAEQDRIRREEERKRREEEEKRVREAKEEEDCRLAKAAELEQQGKAEEAEAVLDAPVEPPPKLAAPIARPAPVAGVRVQSKWSWRLVDADKLPRAYMKIDEGAIGKVVRAMKGKTNIPGVEAFEEKQVAATAL